MVTCRIPHHWAWEQRPVGVQGCLLSEDWEAQNDQKWRAVDTRRAVADCGADERTKFIGHAVGGPEMDVWPRQPLNKPKGKVWERESDPDTLGGTQG